MVKNKELKANANCNQLILDHFWKISDQSEDKRCRSIQVILQTLTQQVKSTNDSDNDVSYCLDRLVRGLISTREFARHGFCVLLTEILRQFPNESNLDLVLELAEKAYGKKLSNSSAESAISWSLLIGCIIKSGRLTLSGNATTITRLFEYLLELGIKKDYVEIIFCNLLQNFFEIFETDKTQFNTIILKTAKRFENENENKKSVFLTYVILLALDTFPSETKSVFCDFIKQNIYKTGSEDYGKILGMVKETTKYQPNFHPIIELLVKTVLKIEGSEKFAHFCTALVDNIFKVNLEKSSLGFEVVRILLKFIRSDQVESVLSPPFMRIFIQTLSNKKHPLHSSAIDIGNYFIKFSSDIRDDSEFQIKFANCFIKKPGSINFDEMAKAKILASILRNFNDNAIRSWVLMLKQMMIEQENIPTSDFFRIRCLQQIVHLLKSYKHDDDFLWTVNKFLFTFAYFDVGACKSVTIGHETTLETFNTPLSEKLQKQFPDSFKNIFAHLIHLSATSSTTQQDKLLRQIETLVTMVDFSVILLNTKKLKLLASNDRLDIENLKSTIEDITAKIDQISSMEKQQASPKTCVFKLLFLFFAVEMFDHSEEIVAILPDFNECANRSLIATAKLKKPAGEAKLVEDDEGQPMWSDVLTDLFLSLLTTKSKYTKNVIMNAYKHISPFLTQVSIQSLINAILDKDAVVAGDDFDDGDEDEEEEGDDDMEHDANDDEIDESESSDDDNPMDCEDDEEVDANFKLDVIKALGSAAQNSTEEDDSDTMGDEEMFKIDDSLAEVFRKKFGHKKDANERKNLVQNFKHRALEMVQIVVEHMDISFAIALDLVSSLVQVSKMYYAIKTMAPFTYKCICIFNLISKKRFSGNQQINGNLDENRIKNVFDELFQFQYKCSNSELQKSLISVTAWLVITCKDHLANANIFRPTMERALKDFFGQSNTELKINLFMRLIPPLCELEKSSFFESDYYNVLIEFSFKQDIRSFKRNSALDILCTLLKSVEVASPHFAELGSRSIATIIEELNNLAITASKATQPIPNGNSGNNSHQTKLQSINLMFKLIMACNVFQSSNSKNMTLLRQLDAKLNSVPKIQRKKLDKVFVRKLRNVVH